MADFVTRLAPNTWTNLTALFSAKHGVLRTELTDLQVALQATAPTTGTQVLKRQGVEYIIGVSTANLWAKSTAGGQVELDYLGGRLVLSVAGAGVVA